jgi:putative salt-induced outer membrane protein
VAALALLLPVAPAFAQWSGKGEAGIAIASGNTDTKSGNARLVIGKKVEAWEHSVGLAGNYVSDDTGTTGQRFELFGQTRYQFNARDFWFGGARYEDDRFSGFNYQAILSTGVGRKFVDTDDVKFIGQAGVGYKVFETRDTIDPDTLAFVPGDRDSEAVLAGGFDYSNKLTDTTTFFDKFGFEAASENTFLQNEIGVAVKMKDNLALAVALAVRHNTEPPPGFKKTDTLTTVNLVYELK